MTRAWDARPLACGAAKIVWRHSTPWTQWAWDAICTVRGGRLWACPWELRTDCWLALTRPVASLVFGQLSSVAPAVTIGGRSFWQHL